MKFRGYRGFALPTILIVSVILMSVLVVASVSVAGVRSTMAAQYYNQIAKNASEAGIAYAKACVKARGGVEWSDTKPLRPFTDCTGTTIMNSSDPNYYISVNGNAKATFFVGYPSVDSAGNYTVFKASGSVDLVRTSNGIVWRTYSQNTTSSTAYVDDGLPLGTSLSGYWSTPPEGYLFEDGSAVSRTTYADLFDLIGTTFGSGDGSTTFNLPDSRGRASVNINDLNPGDIEFDTLGEKYGAKTHTLSVAELPSHAHTYPRYSSMVSLYTGTATPNRWWNTQTATTGSAGSGGAHNNIQPSIVKMSVIKYLKPESHNSELPAGTSLEGYWGSAPSGYLYENGAAVSRSTYSSLFSTISTNHGSGDGSTTFNLPDSRGRLAVNLDTADATFNEWSDKPGLKTHQLSATELPSHTHSIDTIYLYPRDAQSGATYSNMWYGQISSTAACNGCSNGYHNNIQPSITKRSVIKYTASDSSAASIPVGSSIGGYWANAPESFSLERGGNVSRYTYSSLFNILGTIFGSGDGSTTFGLPNSVGHTAVNINPSDVEFDTIGEKYGSKTHQLTLLQIPGHTHSFIKYGTLQATGYTSSYTLTWMAQTGGSSGSAGGNASHNNIQPSIVKNFAIKLTGGVTASGVNLLSDSSTEKTGSNETLNYKDLTSIFDTYGSRQYTISFDIKSADTSVASTAFVNILSPDYPEAKYNFTYSSKGNVVPVSTSYSRQSISGFVSPNFSNSWPIWMQFHGTTGTGNILSVKNVKVELGSKATAWTPASGEVKALVVAGGGSGGGSATSSGGGGGGGAGGLVYTTTLKLNTQAPYAVTIGSGGTSVSGALMGNTGGNSSFAGLTAYGGGGGGAGAGTLHAGLATVAGSTGSGGGAGYNAYTLSTPGYGTSGQGYNGGQNGATSWAGGGGGGGAGGVGGTGRTSHCGGLPGVGRSIDISGSSITYSTGGYGGGCVGITSGAANTGDGGGAVYGNTTSISGAGGSGIVVVSYPTGTMIATGGDITYSGGYTIHTFRSSGTFTVQSIAI